MTSPQKRLKRLLEQGFYPAELPPPFRVRKFFDAHRVLQPKSNYSGSTIFFDGSTFRGLLRTFGIVNPINYLLLSRFIVDNWTNITSVYDLSKCSGSRPKFVSGQDSTRAIAISSMANLDRSKSHLASSYPVVLSLDINRFYGSIYTHSLPWAIVGKEKAKNMLARRTIATHWSNQLDKFVRNCNQSQTIGIPIGPDTSRIISEIILSRLDYELVKSGTKIRSRQIYHNIDDYKFGALDVRDAENIQSNFVRILSRYELKINDFKTSTESGINSRLPSFNRIFDSISFLEEKKFVTHFFEALFNEITSHREYNVAGYALKRFAVRLARSSEKGLVKEYLQRLIFAEPHQGRWVFPILLGIYKKLGVDSEMRRVVRWGLETSVRRNDVGSAVWYIYAALFLKIRLSSDLCNKCVDVSSELVDLMLFHGRSAGLFKAPIDRLRDRYLVSEFKSSVWLVIYEVSRRGWDNSVSFNKIGTGSDVDGYYDKLRQAGTEFYSTDDDYFRVEAFEGWNLSGADFEMEGRNRNLDWDIDPMLLYGLDVENYE